MKTATHTRVQIAVAVISFASLVVFAASAPAPTNEMQSFIGTAPSVTAVAEQPATF